MTGALARQGEGDMTTSDKGQRNEQRTKDKRQRKMNKEQRTKNKEQKTKDKRQKTKDKRQTTKDKGQRTAAAAGRTLRRWLRYRRRRESESVVRVANTRNTDQNSSEPTPLYLTDFP
jgi:hypothetical protein